MTESDVARIRHLELTEFRAHHSLSLDIPPGGLRLHGPNGSGKTTILEAIQLLSTTRPRYGATEADLINHESGKDLGLPPFARVVGEFDRAGVVVRLEAYVEKPERGGAARKTLKVGDRPRRAADIVGLVPTVSFSPVDLDLILGAPSTRRRFLDVLLSQIDRHYLRCLSRYAKILTQRNGLLRRAGSDTEHVPAADQFTYWDEQLVALGAYLVAARARVVERLAVRADERFHRLASRAGPLVLTYQSTVPGSESWWRSVAQDARDAVDAAQRVGVAFERELAEVREQEFARGSTLIGPHRDDLVITIGGHSISRFGSRGQQRIAVVAVKLAEIDVIGEATGLRPIFLVDDVLSELDATRREALLETVVDAGSQLIVTSTDAALLDVPELEGALSVALG